MINLSKANVIGKSDRIKDVKVIYLTLLPDYLSGSIAPAFTLFATTVKSFNS